MESTEQEEMYRDPFSRTARTTAASHLLLSSAQEVLPSQLGKVLGGTRHPLIKEMTVFFQ